MTALIEREHETVRLHDAISEAKAGRGTTILIEGAPGIGKTALLRQARELAAAAELQVLDARGADLERDLGFAVIRDMFEATVLALSADERRTVLAGAARLATGPLGLEHADSTPVELGSAIHGIYWLCANLADRGPMFLAVDDAHWADEPSLLFLTYLARRASELPLVICATTRPAESEPLKRYLTALRTHSNEVLAPETLSDDGVTRVIASVFTAEADPEFIAACAKTSGGNPFLLVEMLTALKSEGAEPSADQAGQMDELRPEALKRTLLARVARLGPEAGHVASNVAILGIDAEFGRVARLTGLETDVVSDALDGLRREGIVAPNGRIGFVHPLIRAAIYSDIVEPKRGLGHLRAARVLDADGRPERAASHLLIAERHADPWVVGLLRRSAAEALSNGAPASAAAMLTRADEEPAPEDERPSLRLDLGRALTRAGDLDSASAALQRALEGVDDPVERAGIALELGQVHRLAGRAADAVEVLGRAVQALPGGHHDEEVSLETEIAFASHMGLPVKEWIDRFAAVVERAGGLSPSDRMARSYYSYVAATSGTGTAEQVARLARSAVAPADETDPPVLLQIAAAGLAMSGAPGDALVMLDRAIATAQQMGDAVQYGFVSLTRGWMAYRAGRIRELEADARAGLPVALDGFLDLPWALAGVVIALIERGSPAEAAALLAEHGLDTTTELNTAAAASLLCTRGRLRYTLARPREAIADLEQCREVVTNAGVTAPVFIEWRTDLARAHLAVGEREKAREVAAEDLTLSRAFGAPREIGMALRTSGLVEGGDPGLDLLAGSVDVLAPSEAELEHAKSLVELGAALRRAGRRSDAQDRLRSGLDVASRCGSLATVARARDELIAAGARPRRERLTGPDSLTASELRVARMAAEGRSNPEIAQALFVTRRTVEVHLTHVYRKLGIESREDLSSALGPRDA
jgi:DNA-binding CsgD family transcriptional regulator